MLGLRLRAGTGREELAIVLEGGQHRYSGSAPAGVVVMLAGSLRMRPEAAHYMLHRDGRRKRAAGAETLKLRAMIHSLVEP